MSSPRTGRPRDSGADEKLLAATLAVLRERGPDGVTIEAACQAAGVAKTTAYRRYRNAEEMLTAALQTLRYTAPDLDHPDPRDRLVTLLTDFQRGIEQGIGVLSFAALIVDPHSPFAELLRHQVLRPRLQAIASVVQECQHRGILSADVDPETVVLMMAGYYFTHTAVDGGVSTDWASQAVRAWASKLDEPHAAAAPQAGMLEAP